MTVEVQSVVEKHWKPNPGKQELYLSLPDSIFEQFYGGAAGGGKACNITCSVSCIDGFKKLEDVHVGDIVIDSDGLPNPVIYESEIMEDRPCYKIYFDNGKVVIADEQHLWPTLTYNERNNNFKLTPEYREQRKFKRESEAERRRLKNLNRNPHENRGRSLRPDLALINSIRNYNYVQLTLPTPRTTLEIYNTLEHNGRINHSIDVTQPTIHPHKELLIHPYILGVWLGDGNSGNDYFTAFDNKKEILDRIISLGYYINPIGSEGILWKVDSLLYNLRVLQLINNKHIPFIYLCSSIEQRLELLRGLIDTDGHIAEDGSIEISSSYPQLAKDIYLLINSLGIKTFANINKSSYKNKNGEEIVCKDRCRIKFITNLKVATIQSKLSRIIDRDINERNKVHYIKEIVPVSSVPVKCIGLLNKPNQYLVTDALIPTHNSEVLLMKPIVRQWIDNNRFQAIILRRTYKELEESLIERSKRGGQNKDGTEIPSFYDFGAEYNEQKKKWRFPSGATITFGHAEEESDIRKYDTSEYQYCAFDELTSFTEFQYKFMAFSRVRSIIPSIPALVCSASNPGNIGHRWVRERFVEPCTKGMKIIAEKIRIGDNDMIIKRIFVPAMLADNPRLMENDPLYRVRLEMLPEADRRAKAYGDWWTFSGQAFSEFRAERFPDEPSNAIHVIPPVIPDARLPRILALDWGRRAMTYGMWGVPLPKKRTLIYKEFSTEKPDGSIDPQSVKTWTTTVANECLMEGINPYVVLDPSAWQDRGVKTIAQQFIETWREIMGNSPKLEKADNDRVGGKSLIHDYLRWRALPRFIAELNEEYDSERANWIFRNKGVEAHKAYLSKFAPQSSIQDEILPRLQITSNCKVLIRTLPLCVYDEKNPNSEDIKEFVGDDPYDDLRYFLKKVDTMSVEELPELPSERSERAEDWNRFYRKMEMLEASHQTKKSKFIVMGRRRGVRFN